MTTNKRKKNSRERGSKTHGCGSMKKRRGKGNKGGAGRAGSGKRSDAKKPKFWKNVKYFGKYGFKSRKKKIKAINLQDLEKKLDDHVNNKIVTKDNDLYIVDLDKLRIEKILSKGNITKKIKVINGQVSKSAGEKIKKAGGEVAEA